MIFSASEQQLRRIIFNAIEASKPLEGSIGLQYALDPFDLKPELIKLNKNWLNFDYVYGRCVKLYIIKVEQSDDCYKIEYEPNRTSQTWVCKYPTNKSLIESVIINSSLNYFLDKDFPLEGFTG
jgi:hypothetical protein